MIIKYEVITLPQIMLNLELVAKCVLIFSVYYTFQIF